MTDADREFRAVQEDATAFCMDWPVFESWDSREIGFNGTVFVLDSSGVKVSHSSWDSPSDESSDEALASIGWTRSDPWEPDELGRHTARVVAMAPREPVPLPAQRTAPLAEEATLHFA